MKMVIGAAFFSGFNFVAIFLDGPAWMSIANGFCAIYCMYVAVKRGSAIEQHAYYIHESQKS